MLVQICCLLVCVGVGGCWSSCVLVLVSEVLVVGKWESVIQVMTAIKKSSVCQALDD